MMKGLPKILDRPDLQQQECLLERVLLPNRDCDYGSRHGFCSIRSPQDYQKAVPICSYEDLRKYVERMLHGETDVLVSAPVRRFFRTSGTTAAPKYVPVTDSLIRDKWRAFQMYWNSAFEAHPDARRGVVVTNFSDSSSEEKTAAGLLCGSESAFWSAWTSGPRVCGASPLPKVVSKVRDVEARYYTIARILLGENVSTLMTLNPSTMLALFDTMDEHADRLLDDIERGGIDADLPIDPEARAHVEKRYPGNTNRARQLRDVLRTSKPRLLPTEIWPQLRLVVSWRSPMVAPYLKLLEPYVGSVPQRDYISMASEGVIAIPLEDGGNGGVLATSIHYYEFVPEEQAVKQNPDVLLAHELEAGKNYEVLLSTSGGLYRYNIGDVLHVRGIIGATPIVEFLYRAGATCSLTGEKLTENHVVGAISAAAVQVGVNVHSYTMFPATTPFPHYVLLAEFAAPTNHGRLKTLLHELDRQLGHFNVEYSSKRKSRRLGAPELWVTRSGSYADWRRKRMADGANDAQIKAPCLTRDACFHRHFDVVAQIDAN
jgi:hypothetical protein